MVAKFGRSGQRFGRFGETLRNIVVSCDRQPLPSHPCARFRGDDASPNVFGRLFPRYRAASSHYREGATRCRCPIRKPPCLQLSLCRNRRRCTRLSGNCAAGHGCPRRQFAQCWTHTITPGSCDVYGGRVPEDGRSPAKGAYCCVCPCTANACLKTYSRRECASTLPAHRPRIAARPARMRSQNAPKAALHSGARNGFCRDTTSLDTESCRT